MDRKPGVCGRELLVSFLMELIALVIALQIYIRAVADAFSPRHDTSTTRRALDLSCQAMPAMAAQEYPRIRQSTTSPLARG
ncbi:hypothetical protein B0J12DRAFT_688588 [Macrophomina phaseolina]|uniref:Uncharacterized protein n=1 Tax=Macrophomina phaseolina TaxID=35725 RepID=A0ABQ8FRP9_9PEZI|nr:hypothetical protein B0J12DRAFT_688588 [Macrophomina phaseolina]